MKFVLLDRIIELVPGREIRAVKAVSASEEYLADHFPTFPVLPGVFMLEVMAEAAGWLARVSRDFSFGVTLLRRVRNVTYKRFVKPGGVLDVVVTCHAMTEDESEFSGVGTCDGRETVKGRFTLSHLRLSAVGFDGVEEKLIGDLKRRYALLRG